MHSNVPSSLTLGIKSLGTDVERSSEGENEGEQALARRYCVLHWPLRSIQMLKAESRSMYPVISTPCRINARPKVASSPMWLQLKNDVTSGGQDG